MTPLVATIHPAFVLRSRRWESVFRNDVAKAIRHARGTLRWRDPEVLVDPTPDSLRGVLARLATARLATVDTETDGLDPERCALRCVGLASNSLGVAVGFRSVTGAQGIYAPHGGTPRPLRCAPDAGREVLRNFFALAGRPGGPRRIVVHNQVFDQPVLERHGMPLPDVSRVVDTIMLHRSADSEMQHDLDFLGSLLTDAPKWKPEHGHDAWQSDEDLHRYCVLDCCVPSRLAPELRDEVVRSRQEQVYVGDVELQRLAIGMRRAGVLIDRDEQQRHGSRLRVAMREASVRAAAATVGSPLQNIGSDDQVRAYLFERLGLPGTSVYTPLGDPSVDKDAIYELLQRSTLDDQHRAFLGALLDYRRAQKAVTSYVENLRPDGDGRLHVPWNPHSTKVGRLSCGDKTIGAPSLQTIPDTKQDPDSLRSMFVAAPGCVLVGADYDQLHARIIAVRAGVGSWLETFALADRGDTSRRADFHYVNAAMLYGKPLDGLERFERATAKIAFYAGVYGAGVATWLAQFVRVRDPVTGHRPFAGMTYRQAEALRTKWLRIHSEIPAWWDREVRAWRSGGDVRSMIYGRLLRLRDLGGGWGEEGEGLSDIVNGPVLSTEGDLMGGNWASYRAMRAIGWPWFGDGRGMDGPGLWLHNHDALYAEVGAGRAEEAKAALKSSMETTLRYEGREVRITCKPKAGRRWSDLA